MNYAVIFAGGVGARMGTSTPKQFLEVDDKPIIIHTVEKFNNNPLIDGIVVVCKAEYILYCKNVILKFGMGKVFDVIPGGETGQLSIYNGVAFLHHKISKDRLKDIVLIHDGVRPIITDTLIANSIKCAEKYGNSIAASKAIETVIRVDEQGSIIETIERSNCRNAKAPQCFYLSELWEIHRRALNDNMTNMIDSATLMSHYGYTLYTIECSQENIKITTPNDYFMFKGMYEAGL